MSTVPTNTTSYKSIMSGPSEHYDILVVGKSGNGKSALCNTLLGQEKFTLGRSMTTTTTTVQYAECRRGNVTYRVIDTPDLMNCGKTASDREAEVRKWGDLLASSEPSMVLVAVRSDVRYTAEEYAVFNEILRFWRTDGLTKNLVVAFTFGDRQDYDIGKDVRNAPPELGNILRWAKKRYLMFTNKDSDDRPAQAARCFSMLQELQEDRHLCSCCCFTL